MRFSHTFRFCAELVLLSYLYKYPRVLELLFCFSEQQPATPLRIPCRCPPLPRRVDGGLYVAGVGKLVSLKS